MNGPNSTNILFLNSSFRHKRITFICLQKIIFWQPHSQITFCLLNWSRKASRKRFEIAERFNWQSVSLSATLLVCFFLGLWIYRTLGVFFKLKNVWETGANSEHLLFGAKCGWIWYASKSDEKKHDTYYKNLKKIC